MNAPRTGWSRFRAALSRIPLTDRILVLFMVVLLAQSAWSLLSGGGGNTESDRIDVIVRTASAAIFGYLLSAKGRRPAGGSDGAGNLLAAAAAGVGLFCLVTLLILRNLSLGDPAIVGSDSATATVAQFRDFVSGCVGLLIGAPSGQNVTPPESGA